MYPSQDHGGAMAGPGHAGENSSPAARILEQGPVSGSVAMTAGSRRTRCQQHGRALAGTWDLITATTDMSRTRRPYLRPPPERVLSSPPNVFNQDDPRKQKSPAAPSRAPQPTSFRLIRLLESAASRLPGGKWQARARSRHPRPSAADRSPGSFRSEAIATDQRCISTQLL
jgi:hypothetical protein